MASHRGPSRAVYRLFGADKKAAQPFYRDFILAKIGYEDRLCGAEGVRSKPKLTTPRYEHSHRCKLSSVSVSA